ncbi:MAG: error-prone DNA polymerase [Polyangiales bacterium]
MDVELHVASAFSFLYGASLPEDLAARAAELGLRAVALCDRDGVAGIPRFHRAARAAGVRPIVGTSVLVTDGAITARVALYVRTRAAYRALCRALTDARMSSDREIVRHEGLSLSLEALRSISAHGLSAMLLAEGAFARLAHDRDERAIHWANAVSSALAAGECFVERRRTLDRYTQQTDARIAHLGAHAGIDGVATVAPRAAVNEHCVVADIFDCARLHTTLARVGTAVEPNRERVLKSPQALRTLFYDEPEARANAERLAERCEFSLEDLGYEFPSFGLPAGVSAQQHLEHLVRVGARERYEPLYERVRAQLRHELDTIARLDLAGYFLVVWDIVRFCRERGILVQGRGSAANSAVCYALGITAVDPVGMELLFERFLSESRGEWPDIDLDLPSGDHREEVIQYVYRRYGERGAAMTANVITYRARAAAREAGKALGFAEDALSSVAKQLGWFGTLDRDELRERFAQGNVSPEDPRVARWIDATVCLQNLPRHLGQHPGGMVIARGRLDELCPLEPAAMPKRVIVPWDKDDCEDLGILKVDLLGLGMMALFERVIPLVSEHDGVEIDLARIPPDDPETYAMIQRADTIGVFQIESRAQMNTLPRLKPERFYDLVVEVALIRPGPIVGKMVHPYLRRRSGREPVTYAHPSLEPVLRRTLGVPLFQEQLMRVAMVAAGFSGAEAEELRRAMGSKRSVDRMKILERKLRDGMTRNGYAPAAQEDVVRGILSFALYGFPESHSASFALLAYASAYLKRHFTASFTCALLDCWPMGFYSPATVVQDAKRHGVRVLPIDVSRSGWLCSREGSAVRLGLRYAHGLRESSARSIERARSSRPFVSIDDLARRTRLRTDELTTLAELGAMASLPHPDRDRTWTRRSALWQVLAVSGQRGAPLFNEVDVDPGQSPLPEMSRAERVIADLANASITVGAHPVALVREALSAQGIVSIAEALAMPNHRSVSVGGAVITRQKPPTAKGFFFLTIEDESGILNAIIPPAEFETQRGTMVSEPLLVLHGVIQREDGVVSVRVARVEPFSIRDGMAHPPSHDFR